MSKEFYVDPDITRAETLPASFYSRHDLFLYLREQLFARSWQWLGDTSLATQPGKAHPLFLLEGYLNEPLVVVRDQQNALHCLSNVCTHRGNLVIRNSGKYPALTCGYHGRKFDLDGSFISTPGFDRAREFPRACEHLRSFPLKAWDPLLFTCLDEPLFAWDELIHLLDSWVGFLPHGHYHLDIQTSRDYEVEAHWALYVENYLEGFHLPFVHRGLHQSLKTNTYQTLLFDFANLQIADANDEEVAFSLPEEHPEAHRRIAAFYFWIFPNLMLNFYPWGLSLNVVKPLGLTRTRVMFRSYVFDASLREKGAGSALDQVEREDEFIVEAVQRGVQSRTYRTGRFSPDHEQGVHHFQRLLSDILTER